ncbi:MAG: DUF11 domain-containing protein [Acidobacteria bacterium]|nr:DUF11 domain-containing protein [Acidobacteriota bacterium]
MTVCSDNDGSGSVRSAACEGWPGIGPYSTTPVPSIITYTLTFQNNGPSNSAGTAIVDVLPKGFTLESWTSTVAGTTLSQSTVNGTTTLSFAPEFPGPVAGNPLSGAIRATTFATGGTITIRAGADQASGHQRNQHGNDLDDQLSGPIRTLPTTRLL